MKRRKRNWRLSPGSVAMMTAACLISLLLALSWLSARRSRIHARVEITDPIVETAVDKPPASPRSPLFPDGEVERTALRVREVSALVIGLTLFAVSEGLSKRPIQSVAALTDRFAARDLLPPNVERHSSSGIFVSKQAAIYIRYRSEPLAIEAVSLGREPLDGPAIIGRIITGSEETSNAGLFIARQLTNITLPAPFTSTQQISPMNWSVEPLRERAFTPQELAQISGWLQTQGFK